MLSVRLPETNHKPSFVELLDDGHYIGRIWAHDVEVSLNPQTNRFMLRINGPDGSLLGYLWPETIQPKP